MFSVNYIVGTGFLTLPSAIFKSGLLLGTCIVLFTGLLANLAMECLLEAMARAVPLLEHRRRIGAQLPVVVDQIEYGAVRETESEEINDKEKDNTTHNVSTKIDEEVKLVVGDERIELPALCELYLGEKGKTAYMMIICIYIVITLWSFAVIVGQTFAMALPLSDEPDNEAYKYSYWFYLSVYGVAVTFLATQEMSGPIMAMVNLGFFIGRLATVVFMVFTLLVAISHDTSDDDGVFVPSAPTPMIDSTGVLITLPISLFAMIFHHSIPTLSEPAIHKSQVSEYFTTTLVIVTIGYLFISLPAAIYFGADVKDCVSLNWVSYNPSYYAPLAAFIRNMIIFFPAFSLLSSYPLMCITLSNNILSFGVPFPETVVRLIAAVPPLLFAAIGTDLTTVAAIGGVLGFLIALIFPVLLQRASLKAMEAQFGAGSSDTVYSSCLTRSTLAVGCLGAFGTFLLVASSIQIVYSFTKAFWEQFDTNPEWG